MSDIQLSMAINRYDHVSDLVSGRVRVEGVELTAMELPIEDIFFRMFCFAEWDIAEFSMAKYVSLVASGNSQFTAIPVFPSRVFRQSAIYITADGPVRTHTDLLGKRVGVPEWTQTAGIYARAFLQHQCGLNLADMHWVQAGVNQPGRTEKVLSTLPEGVSIEEVPGKTLNDMLLAGEIDAIISAREPAAFVAHDPRIARLWPDYRSIEENYLRDTGIFPIMHTIVIKKSTLGRNPWVAMNLFRAFETAKWHSLERLSSIVNSSVPIPWAQDAFNRAQLLLGPDVWPYGIDANRKTLDAFLKFSAEQGVTQRELTATELFPQELSKTFKV